MLHIREVSDLHLEHYYDLYDSTGNAKLELTRLIPPLPTDKKTVLLVCGDLATARRAGRIVTFLEILVPRFMHVIYVLGNHEHYNTRKPMSETIKTICEAIQNSSRINSKKLSIVGNEPEKIIIKDVTFLCGTMWTDYCNGDANVSMIVSRYITDHKIIIGENGLTAPPAEMAEVFKKTISQFDEWMSNKDNKKTVICTHHLPSFKAVDAQYTVDPTSRILNHAFASDLDDFILKHKPAYWFFGHTHTRFHGSIGDTIISCNPLGYPRELNDQDGRFRLNDVYSL